MKKIFYSALMIGLVLQSCGEQAQEETTAAETTHEEGNVTEDDAVMVDGYAYYGIKEMTAEGAVSVEEMQAMIDSTGAFEGKINTKLAGVCKKAGCWVTIENPSGEPIRVVFGEHAFFVPIDTEEGKDVIIEGVATIDTTSIDMQKHFLDDAKEAGKEVSQADYDAITADKIEISFNASGILIKP